MLACTDGQPIVLDQEENRQLLALSPIQSLKELGMGSNLFSFESMARLRALRPDIESSALRPWDGDPLTNKQIWIHGKGGRCIRVGKSEASRQKVSAILADLQNRWDEIGARAVAARTQSKFVRGKTKEMD